MVPGGLAGSRATFLFLPLPALLSPPSTPLPGGQVVEVPLPLESSRHPLLPGETLLDWPWGDGCGGEGQCGPPHPSSPHTQAAFFAF